MKKSTSSFSLLPKLPRTSSHTSVLGPGSGHVNDAFQSIDPVSRYRHPRAHRAFRYALLGSLGIATATYAQNATPDSNPPAQSQARDLGRVVVTGTGLERRLADTPVRTEVVVPADLSLIQAYKLSDAIEYTPGIRLDNTCQNCNTTEIQMLGLSQQYLAILQDGIPNFSGLAGVYGVEQLPVALIEQIEVVKGGGSTLYGPGAVAGVINLITRTPTQNGYQFDAAWNSMQGASQTFRPNRDFTGVVDLIAPSQTFGITLHGYHSYVNPVDVIGDGFSEVSMRDLTLGGARAFWKPVTSGRLTLDYLGSHEFRRGGSMGPGQLHAPPNTVELAEQIRSKRHVGIASWEHAPSLAWDYRLTISVADTRRDSYYGGTGPLGGPSDPDWDPSLPSESDAPRDSDGEPIPPFNVDWSPDLGFGTTDNRLIFVEGLVNYRNLDPHIITLGVQYRHETLEDLASFRQFRDRYENIGVLLQDEWEPSLNWTFLGGVRVDQHNLLNDPVFSPRGSVLWKPRDDFRMRSSVSTGFRGPELFDEDLHVDNVGGELQVVRRSPDLREESSVSFSLGPEWDFHSHWSVDANLFYTILNNTFFNALDEVQDETGIQKRTKVNAGGARVFGGEVNLVYRCADTFRFEIGYVEQRNRYNHPQLLIGDETGEDPDDNPIFARNFIRVPNRYAVARMFYDPGWARFFAGGRLTGPMDIPHIMNDLTPQTSPLDGSYPGQPALLGNALKRSPYFFTLDLSVSKDWRLGGTERPQLLTTTLGCRNVLDAFQRDLDRGKYRDAAYVYGPRFPRTLFATVSLRF